MFRVELHEYIGRISSVCYRVGVWHREDQATLGELSLKLFYSIYFILFIISMITGGDATDDIDELIFVVEFTLIVTVVLVKFLYIIWKKKEILELLNRICVYSVEDADLYEQVNAKSDILMKFVAVYFSLIYFCGFCIEAVIPFLGSERRLFFNIRFPLDWKHNEFAYWIAFTFTFIEVNIAAIAILFSAIIWYLMINCGSRFEVLGQQIRTMGKVKSLERIGIATERKISDAEQDNFYLQDLIKCIQSHSQLKELTNQLDLFLSELFVAQLTTSALCICCAIYSLAFSKDDSSLEYVVYAMALFYNIFDIFMIMHFGDDIGLSSGSLSYCLFQSDWIGRPHSTKKIVLIFGEFLVEPHRIFILKTYPLNVKTFMRILKSAYSTFNILQNFK